MDILEQNRTKRRWDIPFAKEPIHDDNLRKILALPFFRRVNPADFPDDLRLADIIANDARINVYDKGQPIYQQGEYGGSVFLILRGSVSSQSTPQIDHALQQPKHQRPAISSLARVGEIISRITRHEDQQYDPHADQDTPASKRTAGVDICTNSSHNIGPTTGLQHDQEHYMYAGEMFGISAALNRTHHHQTILAKLATTVILEIRLPGIRDLRFWSDEFRQATDVLYRERVMKRVFGQSGPFSGMDDNILNIVASHAQFQSYGTFDWTHQYQRELAKKGGSTNIIEHEPVIAQQGHYLNDIIILSSGFARVARKMSRGEQTTGVLESNQLFGLQEFSKSQLGEENRNYHSSLRAVGYADIVRIPTPVFEKYLWPIMSVDRDADTKADRTERDGSGTLISTPPEKMSKALKLLGHKFSQDRSNPPTSTDPVRSYERDQQLLEFVMDNRFLNGTSAMVINTDLCVDCDECVRACAATHSNASRFVRKGKTHQNIMIAHACMHCIDPVCLIDCPTGAIERDAKSGNIAINDDTCIGCTACANACPYKNITMEPIKDYGGNHVADTNGVPSMKAVKCDHCISTTGGPACQRACPTGALLRIDLKKFDQIADWLQET